MHIQVACVNRAGELGHYKFCKRIAGLKRECRSQHNTVLTGMANGAHIQLLASA
jgi:hypothetical protein